MTSFQGSSEFSGDSSNSRASMEPRPSVGRFPSAPAPSPLSVLGPASRNAQPQSPGLGMGGNLHALPDSAQLQQAQQLHREQGNLHRYQGNASPPRQLFNPVPANDDSRK